MLFISSGRKLGYEFWHPETASSPASGALLLAQIKKPYSVFLNHEDVFQGMGAIAVYQRATAGKSVFEKPYHHPNEWIYFL